MGGAWVERVVIAVLAAVVLAAAMLTLGVPAASAEALSPWWGVTSGSQPTNLVPGEPDQIVVSTENRGDAATAGEVTISDRLPAGLHATAIEAIAGEPQQGGGSQGPVSCTLATLTCTFGTFESEGVVHQESLPPYQQIEVRISVVVEAGAHSGEENTAIVSGGGATASASANKAIEVNGTEKFGVEDFQAIAENAGGSLDTQAGSHPFQLTSVVTLNTRAPEPGGPATVGQPKDIVPELPAGLLADPIGLAQCTEGQLAINRCPAQSAVGAATVTFHESANEGVDTVATPIFNIEPLRGEPARFGINLLGSRSVLIETQIRSGGDYGVKIIAGNITQTVWLLSLKLTFWGVPGDQRHDAQRGLECLKNPSTCTPTTAPTTPFLSLPSSCAGPLQSTVEGDSWAQAYARQKEGLPPQLEPLGETAMAARGLQQTAVLSGNPRHPRRRGREHPQRAERRSARPADRVVQPRRARRVLGQGHHDRAAGRRRAEPRGRRRLGSVLSSVDRVRRRQRTSGEIGDLGADLHPVSAGQLRCARGRRGRTVAPGRQLVSERGGLGTGEDRNATAGEPAGRRGVSRLAPELPGRPSENPLGSLVAVYVVAEEPEAGVLVKLPGKIELGQQTGQITVTFEDTPRLPFEDIDLAFFGGERALLATPARCGSFTTNASFVPWSATLPGGTSSPFDEAALTVHATSTFAINSGPNGGVGISPSPCPGQALPFAPSLTGGTTSLQAGSYSPLTVSIGREDGQQAIQSLQLKAAARPLGDARRRTSLRGNAGQCRYLSRGQSDRRNDGLGGAGRRALHAHRREGVPHRAHPPG